MQLINTSMNTNETNTEATNATINATPDTMTTPDTNNVKITGNVLVHYGTHRAGLSVTHKRITNENCTATGADKKALRTVARIFESKNTPVGEILSLFAQTRLSIQRLGLRLSTGGILVRGSKLEELRAIFDKADDQLERLRGELRRQYPQIVEVSKSKLQAAAADIVFPTAEEAAAKFTHNLDYVPDPTSGEVLLEGVSDEVAAKVRAQVDRTREVMLRDAHSNLVKELLGFLTGTCESDPGILGILGSDCTLKQTRFTRLRERLEEAKSLNYLDLPEVTATIEALTPIANADAAVLRSDEGARREMAVTVKGVVDSVTKNSLAALGLSF